MNEVKFNRHQVTQLQFFHPYPLYLPDGRHRRHEETFVNPGGEKTPAEAMEHLWDIKANYRSSEGWVCFDGHSGIFKDEKNGLYYAFYHSALYEEGPVR